MTPNSNNKNILLVAYYFPPLGMGGVGRPYALFRYLPDNGYNLYVLTVKDILYPQYDYSLLGENDESRIFRTGSLDPARLLYKLGKRKQSGSGYPGLSKKLPLYFPDLKRGWISFAWRSLKKIISEKNIAAVITTSPPPSVNLLGLKMKRRFDIPWIADLRDFWFPLPIEKIYPDGFMKNYALKLKNDIMTKADAIVSVNNDIRRYFGGGEVIMNGSDQAVIDTWRNAVALSADSLIIGAFGTFNYLFPIVPLLKAVRQLIDKGEIASDKIKIIQVGHIEDSLNQLIDKYALAANVEKRGYLPKIAAIESMLPTDVLYLGVNKFDDYNILPGRAFDCLVSGKPIIGAVPRGSDIANLLDSYPPGFAVTDYDTDKIANRLYEIYRQKTNGAVIEKIDKDEIDKFGMPALAKKYARLLDSILR